MINNDDHWSGNNTIMLVKSLQYGTTGNSMMVFVGNFAVRKLLSFPYVLCLSSYFKYYGTYYIVHPMVLPSRNCLF